MVFPKFGGGILNLRLSDVGFLAEVEMQVSERVTGFVESRGSSKTEHVYGPGSPYSQREINRFFETTGVCWFFPERAVLTEILALRVLEAYCVEFGVQERDLGVGMFHSLQSSVGQGRCQGICIFDSTNGSLRLTERLAEQFDVVLARAQSLCETEGHIGESLQLQALSKLVTGLQTPAAAEVGAGIAQIEGDWAEVVVPGQNAIYISATGIKEVTVLSYRYTPQGIVYSLEPERGEARWSVPSSLITPYHGTTLVERYNLVTGETQPAEATA